MVRISSGRLSRVVFLLFAVELLVAFESKIQEVACPAMEDVKDDFAGSSRDSGDMPTAGVVGRGPEKNSRWRCNSIASVASML